MRKIAVTGANGFVGTALCPALQEAGYGVRRLVREVAGKCPDTMAVGDIGPDTDWSRALSEVDAVIHLAGRAHIMNDIAVDPLGEYRSVNVHGTERLARDAAASGVKRLIYVSSIKAGCEGVRPSDPYGLSKWEAEQALRQISDDTGLEIVVVRPPLVYGPGVKANMFKLLQWIDKGIPLLLKSVKNRRSLIALDNLVDFLMRCNGCSDAAGMTFNVSDGEDLSTPELIERLAGHMNRRARLISFPVAPLRIAAQLFGQGERIERLCGSLVVDSRDARRLLNWSPPVTVDEGLAQLAHWYRSEFPDGNV